MTALLRDLAGFLLPGGVALNAAACPREIEPITPVLTPGPFGKVVGLPLCDVSEGHRGLGNQAKEGCVPNGHGGNRKAALMSAMSHLGGTVMTLLLKLLLPTPGLRTSENRLLIKRKRRETATWHQYHETHLPDEWMDQPAKGRVQGQEWNPKGVKAQGNQLNSLPSFPGLPSGHPALSHMYKEHMAHGKRKNIPSTESGASGVSFGLKMISCQRQMSGAWVARSKKSFWALLGWGWGVRATHLNVKSVPMSSIDSSSALDLGKESR